MHKPPCFNFSSRCWRRVIPRARLAQWWRSREQLHKVESLVTSGQQNHHDRGSNLVLQVLILATFAGPTLNMGRVVQLAMEEVLKDGREMERKLKTGLVVAGIPLFHLLIWQNFKQRPGVLVEWRLQLASQNRSLTLTALPAGLTEF